MMKRIAGVILGLMLSAQLWAGATFSRITEWTDGQTLTASALNAEFDNILNNGTPSGWDDYSANLSQMQSTADPYPGSVESQATSLAGELERIRYQILEIKKAIQTSNVTYWYQDTPTAGVFTIAGSSVGINDTTPSYALDVTGGFNATGVAVIGSTLTVTTMTTTAAQIYVATNAYVNGNLFVNGTITGPGSYSKVKSHLNANVTISSQTYVPVTFNTEDFDTLSEFDGSTFTATTTGYYFMQCHLTYAFITVGKIYEVALVKNGATIPGTGTGDHLSFSYASDSTASTQASGLFSLTAGDTLSCWTWQGDTAARDLYGDGAAVIPSSNWVSIFRLF